MDSQAPDSGNEQRNVDAVLASLRAVRREARVLLLGSRLFVLLSWLVGSAFLFGLSDFFLRFPMELRIASWLVVVVTVSLLVWRYLGPAWRFCPSLTDVALRVEDQDPELKGVLASAVDFAKRGDASSAGSPVSSALADRVIRDAAQRWSARGSGRKLLRRETPAKRFGVFGIAGAACVVVLVLSPAMWLIGAERVLLPWTDASWPKRTGIVDATETDVHALGTALALRAAVVKSNREIESTNVSVRYRLIVDRRETQTRRELLTWQGRDIDAPDGQSGALFERLMEPMADAIEYRFETEDDQTEWRRITLVEPPAIESAAALITPPDYARSAITLASEDAGADLQVDLGPGTDERAIAPPTLAGSVVELTLTLNRPLTLPAEVATAADSMEVLQADGTEWKVRWVLNETIRLDMPLVDEFGIESADEIVYRFEALADRPSAATVTQPLTDRTVLPSAVLDVVGEGRDDVGLAWVGLEREVLVPAGAMEGMPSGPGGALERREDPVELARDETGGEALARVSIELSLADLDVRPGDEVHLTALAQDLFSYEMPGGQETRSAVRTLMVISESEFVSEIQSRLSEIRQSAIRIAEQQTQLRERVQAGENNVETRRGQGQVSERIGRQAEELQDVVERVRENQLEDEALAGLLRDAGERLENAGGSSTQASQSLEQAGERAEEQAGEEDTPEERAQRNAREAQEGIEQQRTVEDTLRNLIEMLDRGEDTWLVRNSLERLLREQQELREQTGEAGRETQGQQLEGLTPQQRGELESLAQRQRELAQEFEETVDDIEEREEELSEQDPAAAAGLSAAAQRAQQQNVQQSMENAAQQAQENQTARAQQEQQEVEEALEEMLEDLEEGQRARDEVLRRALASIIDSLRGLIDAQQAEIDLLDARALRKEGLAGLDEGMIRLNTNTLGVQDLALRGGEELGPVANLVGRASDAQIAAISELRFPMATAKSVRAHEARSLDYLRQALERAEELEERVEDRQREQKLQELRKAYREMLERQVEIRTETEPLANVERLTRRDERTSRRLGEEEGLVRDGLATLLLETEDLQMAGVFKYAHQRLDASASRAMTRLSDGVPARAIPEQLAVERGIRGILEALSDLEPDDRPFDEPEQAQGGGGGGGGGGPPGNEPLIEIEKELILLRQIQIDLAVRTAELNDAAAADGLNEDILLLGEDQAALMEVGRDLLDRFEQANSPMPGMQGAPRPEGGEEGGDPEGEAEPDDGAPGDEDAPESLPEEQEPPR